MNKAKSANRARHALPLHHILLILLIGGIGVQTFTSCSSDDGDEEQTSQNGGGSSSSTGGGGGGGGSSSSTGGGGGGSSSDGGQPGIQYGSLTDSRDGKVYKTVVIGDQTWMAENLNYAEGGKCYGEGNQNYTPDEVQTNCDTYGRLYNWTAAMNACPDGWHLSSDEEWEVLVTTVSGAGGAGTRLKSTTGWPGNNNGTDDYGFSALPGGYVASTVFTSAGQVGKWWTATETPSGGSAYNRSIQITNVSRENNVYKSWMYSVRCIQGGGGGSSSSVGGGSSSSGNPSGAWCVDHNLGECTNNPFVIENQESCENWLGVFEDSCPAGYTKYDYNNPSGMWCVDYDYGACTDDPYYTYSQENCALWDGVLENSCPL